MKLKVNIKKQGTHHALVECEIPFVEVEKITEQRLAKENDFHISEEFLAEVHTLVIAKALDEAMREKGVKFLGVPEIVDRNYETGKSFCFTARCVLYPTPNIEYKNCFKQCSLSVASTPSVKAVLAELVSAPAKKIYGVLAYKIAEGDTVNLLVEYRKEDGNYLPPVTVEAIVGSTELDLNISTALVGRTKANTVDVGLATPFESSSSERESKIVGARVFIQRISPHQIFDETDDVARAFGLASFAELEEVLERQLRHQSDIIARAQMADDVANRLLDRNIFSIPEELLSHYTFLYPHLPADDVQRFLREKIIFEMIARLESIVLTDEDWEQELARIAIERGYEYRNVEALMSEPSEYDRISHQLLRTKVIAILQDQTD